MIFMSRSLPALVLALALGASSYSGAEGGLAVTVTVIRSNGSSGAVSVSYATGSGNATPGADFQRGSAGPRSARSRLV